MLHVHFFGHTHFLYNAIVPITTYIHLEKRYFPVICFGVKMCCYDNFVCCYKIAWWTGLKKKKPNRLFLYIDKKILHNGILVYSNQTVLQDDNNVILFQFKSLNFSHKLDINFIINFVILVVNYNFQYKFAYKN